MAKNPQGQAEITKYVASLLQRAGPKGMTAKNVLEAAIKYKIADKADQGSRILVFGALRILRARDEAVRIEFSKTGKAIWYATDRCPPELLTKAQEIESTEKLSEEWLLSTAETIAYELLARQGCFIFMQFQSELAFRGKFPHGHLRNASLRAIRSLFNKRIIKKVDNKYFPVNPDDPRIQPISAIAEVVQPVEKPQVAARHSDNGKDDSGIVILRQAVEVQILLDGGTISYQLDPNGQTVLIDVDGLATPGARSIRYSGTNPVEITVLFLSGRTMKLSDIVDALIF